MDTIDTVKLAFDPSSLVLLNFIIGLIMFGVALELKVDDFRRVFQYPKAVLVGLGTQLLLLPALTFAVTMVTNLPASVELGMILVAACPGGNVSNFVTSLAKGNVSLSVTMTAIVTTAAIITTPFNISFWAALNPVTAELLTTVNVSPLRMMSVVGIIIGVPVALGMTLNETRPETAQRILPYFKWGSMFFLGLFVVIGLANNLGPALEYVPVIASIVVCHNLLAFALGRSTAALFGLNDPDSRTVTIEVGIQNAGLALILVFSFFDGLGGMAVVAAFWGMWHIVAGLMISQFWTWRDGAKEAESGAAAA